MIDEQKYEETLRQVGEKDIMADFEKDGIEHIFSESYIKQKEALMIKAQLIERKEVPVKRQWSKAVKAMMASAAALVLVPATVFAAYKLYSINIVDEKHAKQVTIADVSEDAKENVKPVEMKVEYMPDGLEPLVLEPEKAEKGSWQDSENQKRWLDLRLVKVDTKAELLITDLGDKQEFELESGYRALLGNELRNGENVYRGAIFYDEQGYIVEVHASDIGMEELQKVMGSIKLEETTSDGSPAESLAQRNEIVAKEQEAKMAEATKASTPIDINSIHKQQEKFPQMLPYDVRAEEAKQGEFEVSVDEVEILDSATGISSGDVGTPRAYEGIVDGARNLISYQREFGISGNGIDTPFWTPNGEIQEMNRKLLSFKIKVKNQIGEAIEQVYFNPCVLLVQDKAGAYTLLNEQYTGFVGQKENYSMNVHGKEGFEFHCLDFEKDEEKVITVTFVIDEDEIDNTFLHFQTPNGETAMDKYVDVRK